MKTVVTMQDNKTTSINSPNTRTTVIKTGYGFGMEQYIQNLVSNVQSYLNQFAGLLQDLGNETIARSQGDLNLDNRITVMKKYVDNMQVNMNNTLNSFQNSIDDLINTYPKIVQSGVLSGNGSVGSTFDLTQTTFFSIFISPEAGHEAWELTRGQNSFSVNVWHRSGTNRVGYTGKISYSIMQLERMAS